jgi:site-specific DNA recombinase
VSAFLEPPLKPRRGHMLRVLGIARISTEHQDKRSLDDQMAKMREYLTQAYAGPIEWQFIASQGSGEILDRKELYQAEELIESEVFDTVIAEDLARICRRKRAYDFCELCVDHGTRLIALNDRIDTAQNGWEDSAFISTWHHERSNRDTSQRICRSHRNRFQQGGVFQCAIFGYLKPEGAKHEDQIQKDPMAESIYKEWFRRLEGGATYSEIADWLNSCGVALGPYSRQKSWSCAMVARVTHNPILKGLRVRNKMMSRRVNKTGRHRSVKAPPEHRLERVVPHLAFFVSQYYDRIVRIVDERNSKYRRKGSNGTDPRNGVPRKQTIWPGQHLCCGVCGRPYYWSGARENKQMMCSGSVAYKCWNSVSLNGTLAARKLIEAVRIKIETLPDFEQHFVAEVRQSLEDERSKQCAEKTDRARRLAAIGQQIGKVTEAIAAVGISRALEDKLKQLEAERDRIEMDDETANDAAEVHYDVPSAEEIKKIAAEVFQKLMPEDQESARLLRRLIPNLKVYPVRLIDGGAIVLRAKFTLHLAPLISRSANAPEFGNLLRHEMVVDLFDPPQRVLFRKQIMALRSAGLTERQVARQLHLTVTAAQRAATLDRLMQKLNLDDPYVAVLEPPRDYGKLRRHRHPRFQFMPLEDPSNQAEG